jgi:phosphoribosylamine--glycine ligase
VDICKAVINESVASLDLKWSNKSAVCVYAVTEEYPLKSSEHYPIVYRDHIISHVFYGAVTELDRALVTNGGRVLSITAVGMSKDEARIKVYRDLQNVFFDGIHFRTDIGLRNNIQ